MFLPSYDSPTKRIDWEKYERAVKQKRADYYYFYFLELRRFTWENQPWYKQFKSET